MSQLFPSLSEPDVATLLNRDAIGVLPTDTVYGLVGRAGSEPAIAKLYQVKSRERKPGTTIAASVEQLIALGFSADELEIAKKFWPNAVSVELSAVNVPSYLSAGQPVMAARIPNHPALLELLTQTGPLMTTSANEHGAPTSTSVDMAQNYFKDDIDFYVDGGDMSSHEPSTIIGVKADGQIVIYREGAVAIEPHA